MGKSGQSPASDTDAASGPEARRGSRERREFLRLTLPGFAWVSSDRGSFRCESLDFSFLGAALRCPPELSPTKGMGLRIRLPLTPPEEACQVRARVAWVDKDDPHRFGVNFDISSDFRWFAFFARLSEEKRCQEVLATIAQVPKRPDLALVIYRDSETSLSTEPSAPLSIDTRLQKRFPIRVRTPSPYGYFAVDHGPDTDNRHQVTGGDYQLHVVASSHKPTWAQVHAFLNQYPGAHLLLPSSMGALPALEPALHQRCWQCDDPMHADTLAAYGQCLEISVDKLLRHHRTYLQQTEHSKHRCSEFLHLGQRMQQAVEQRLLAEEMQLQTKKTAAVEQLAAGVAHELNTPLQCLASELQFIEEALPDYGNYVEQLAQHATHLGVQLASMRENFDIDFIEEGLPSAVARGQEAVQKLADIVRTMKGFAHTEGHEHGPRNINQCIADTAKLCQHLFKDLASLQLDLDQSILSVHADAVQFNLALVELLENAADAIREEGQPNDGLAEHRVSISTSMCADCVQVIISDTGAGMEPTVIDRAFEPFYTTKGVGRHRGQGLSLVRSVIVEQHGGSVDIDSSAGSGTMIYIELPTDTALALRRAA